MLPLAVSAASQKIDGIYYNLDSNTKTAEVVFHVRYKYSGDLVIPSSVTYEDIDYSVTGILANAFAKSDELTSVTIPSSVTSIGGGLFAGCTSLASVVIQGGNLKYDSRENCNAIIETASNTLLIGCKSTTIPNGVTTIGESAFEGCSGLTYVNIPNSVTSIGRDAFKNCDNLKKVEIDNNAIVSKDNHNGSPTPITSYFGTQVEEYILGDDVTSIGYNAFFYCENLTSVQMSNSITSIGEAAFSHCDQLTTVKMSDNITSIGQFAFNNCLHLTSITIPSGITNLEWVFDGCGRLNKVVINSNAFMSRDFSPGSSLSRYFGSQVKEYVLGEGITRIGNNAFKSCTGLENLYCYAEQVPETGNEVFTYSNYTNATLHVPASTIDLYSNIEQWKYFASIVALTDDDPKPTGIKDVNGGVNTAERYYSLDGKCIATPQRGLNIIRMSDGTTRKIVIK